MLDMSTQDRLNHYQVMKKYFGKQSHNTFCGVQSCCIILNSLSDAEEYNEESFWSNDNVTTVLEESAVRKSGMTLEECQNLLNSFKTVSAVSQKTSDSNPDKFRAEVVKAFSGNGKVRWVVLL